jgi:DNA-binding transcriptional MerR regulator
MKVVMGTTAEIGHTMRSAELARLAGVSTDALRHYERVGVLPRPQRTAGNYRVYPASALDRVRLVRRALSFGFSLAELARIFKVRERGGVPCREARELGKAKLADVERRLGELTTLRAQLKKVLVDWDGRLTRTPSNQRAQLLESLPEAEAPMTSGKISLKRGQRKR